MGTVNIVIAAGNSGLRRQLARTLAPFRDFRLLDQTRNLMETFATVEEQTPHLVILEQALSLNPEFEVMRALFERLDVRWVLVSGENTRDLQRPDRRRSLIAADLFEIDQDMPPDRIADTIRTITRMSIRRAPAVSAKPVVTALGEQERIVLIGASTGGIDALLCVLGQFPADCPPTLVVQHTGAGFGTSLVSLLNRQCRPGVVAADAAMTLARGQVIVAAGLRVHMRLGSGGGTPDIRLTDDPPINGHVPSVDALFHSAVPLAPRIVAALLTGMGRDGADGMLALRAAGADTIAQDAVTSVVYGMPRAAAETGAAARILPLQQIGDALLTSCAQPARKVIHT